MAEDLGEKTELPTPKRMQDAREKGQVAKSTDLAAAIDLVGAALLLVVLGGELIDGLGAFMRDRLADHASVAPPALDGLGAALVSALWGVLSALAPVMAIMVVVGVLAHGVQVGVLFTAEPIRPKLERLDPIAGTKRVFGIKGLVRTGLNTLKLVLVMIVGGAVLWGQLDEVFALPMLTMPAAMSTIGSLGVELAAWLLLVLIVVGVADFAYQRWQHTQDLKMSQQEIRDERRSMDGDPEIKGRRLRMAREIALQRVNSAVPHADVIITNPTHYSVAVRYDPQTMTAPQVVAKGVDELALRIRVVARSHAVPIVERPPLARALYHGVDVGRQISPEFYQAVAEILAYVYRLNEKAA